MRWRGLRSAVSPERQDTVDRLVGAVRNALQSLRRLMVDIYPPDLSGSGLPQALKDLTEPLRAEGIDVSFTVEPPPDMSPKAAAAIYRTAKEALTNVAKHAGASRVWVCLEKTDHNGGRPRSSRSPTTAWATRSRAPTAATKATWASRS